MAAISDYDIARLCLAIRDIDVALWIGPNGTDRDQDEVLAGVNWLGVWSRARDRALSDAMLASRDPGDSRVLVSVAAAIRDSAGTVDYSRICPFFHVDGLGNEQNRFDLQAWQGEKIQQLGSIGEGSVIVCGYGADDRDALLDDLRFAILHQCVDAALVVVAGVNADVFAAVKSELAAPLWQSRLVLYSGAVHELVGQLTRSPTIAESVEDRIRIRGADYPIAPLLRREPPVDEEFEIVLSRYLNEESPDCSEEKRLESRQKALSDLLSGRSPWNAFAKRVDWDRPRLPLSPERLRRHLDAVLEAERIAATTDDSPGKAAPVVRCITIPAEMGSGITTYLQRLAFEAAEQGFPTLMHRSEVSGFRPAVLMSFIDEVQGYEESETTDTGRMPVVLVFDTWSVSADVFGRIRGLPADLARRGIPAVVIRAVPMSSGRGAKWAVDQQALAGSVHRVKEEVTRALSANIDHAGRIHLRKWVDAQRRYLPKFFSPRAGDQLQSAFGGLQNVPLMVCLYSVLTETLRSDVGYGEHLVTRIEQSLPEFPTDEDSTNDDSEADGTPSVRRDVLTGSELVEAVDRLNAVHNPTPGSPRREASEPSYDRSELGRVLTVLSALTSLQLGIGRSTLSKVADVSREKLQPILRLLDDCNLLGSDPSPHGSTRSAPKGFYHREELLELKHPVFGELLTGWLVANHNESGGLTATELLPDDLQPHWGERDIPLRLLEPILGRLTPRPEHTNFASTVSLRYLRLQLAKHTRANPRVARWQWNHLDLLVEACGGEDGEGWIPAQVAQSSATVLHSLGITLYKVAYETVDATARDALYTRARHLLDDALEVAEETRAENPANVLATLGLLLNGWSQRERENGNLERAESLVAEVEGLLRDSLRRRPDNRFAMFGLARHLVQKVQRSRSDDKPFEGFAGDLMEAFELLQPEPLPYFAEDWEDLRVEATGLLGEMDKEIVAMVMAGDEFGYALKAVHELGGRIPDIHDTVVDARDPGKGDVPREGEHLTIAEIEVASRTLEMAERRNLRRRSVFADYLRYCLFSFHPDRSEDPAYDRRLELVERVLVREGGSRYRSVPGWIFDYAMLCFQNERFADGEQLFVELRKGERFREVSRDRTCMLTMDPSSTVPRNVVVEIAVIPDDHRHPWVEVKELGLQGRVPFWIPDDQRVGLRKGATYDCHLRIRPSGPLAVPRVTG